MSLPSMRLRLIRVRPMSDTKEAPMVDCRPITGKTERSMVGTVMAYGERCFFHSFNPDLNAVVTKMYDLGCIDSACFRVKNARFP